MAHKFDRLVEMTLDPNISGGRNISVKRNSASKELYLKIFVDLLESDLPKQEWISGGLLSLNRRNWKVSSEIDDLFRKIYKTQHGLTDSGYDWNIVIKTLAKMNLIDMRHNPKIIGVYNHVYQIRIPSWDEIRERGLEADAMGELF